MRQLDLGSCALGTGYFWLDSIGVRVSIRARRSSPQMGISLLHRSIFAPKNHRRECGREILMGIASLSKNRISPSDLSGDVQILCAIRL